MSTELVAIANDPASLDRHADPGGYVVAVCDHARAWLADLVLHGDIEHVVEMKSTGQVIEKLASAKRYGIEAELAAAEIVRRAERGIGLAVRKGQDEGRYLKQREGGGRRSGSQRDAERPESPSKYFGSDKERSDIYSVTDDVTDEEFEVALKEAVSEGNLSRSNVVRKVKGETVRPDMPATVGNIRSLPRTKSATFVLGNITETLEAVANTIATLDVEGIEPAEAAPLEQRLVQFRSVLSKTINQLRSVTE